MKERILNYMAYVDTLLEKEDLSEDWEQRIREHLVQIEFFQHERMIHLIVTVLFALMTALILVGLVLSGDIWLAILLVPLLILLFPYINHYYLLENGVQKMYRQYDKMLELKKKQSKQ